MAPDTVQNIKVMIDLIFLHNFLAIMYAIGILISILISIYRPSRAATLMLLGFITLLFAFEYSKHIAEPLYNQTLNSLVTVRQSPRIERLLYIFLMRLLPLGLPIVGWILVALGVLGGSLNLKKKPKEAQIMYAEKEIIYSITPQQRKFLNQMIESLYDFKKSKILLSRMLGSLEATLKAGEFDKSISFDNWYKIVNRLELHLKDKGDTVKYKEIKHDIDEMEEFLTHILRHAK